MNGEPEGERRGEKEGEKKEGHSPRKRKDNDGRKEGEEKKRGEKQKGRKIVCRLTIEKNNTRRKNNKNRTNKKKKKKDDSYLETDMKKRQENNEKARKDMEKMGTSMKNPHFEQKQFGWDSVNSMTKAYRAMQEGIRDEDPEKGTEERKKRLEKKRGMTMDDHPQSKKEDVENVEEGTSHRHMGEPFHSMSRGLKPKRVDTR